MKSITKFEKHVLTARVFATLIFLALSLHIALLVLQHGSQWGVYLQECFDFFADILNPIRYSATADPYFDETIHPMHHNQTGIFYIFCWAIARIAKIDGCENLTLEDLWKNHFIMLITFYYLMFCILVLIHSLFCLCKKYKTNKIIIFPLMISYPILFSIERGNHIMFVAACIFYFIAFYDDADYRYRYFACLCLALAASMKIFPASFGLLYFEKKQFKEIITSALLTLILFFLPFLLFKHGIHNIQRFFYNISLYASGENIGSKETIIKSIGLVVLILSLFQKNIFDRLLCIIFPVLVISTRAKFYTTLYFFPLIVILFNQSDNPDLYIPRLYKAFFFLYFSALLSPLMIAKYVSSFDFNSNRFLYLESLPYIFIICSLAVLFRTIKRKPLGETNC